MSKWQTLLVKEIVHLFRDTKTIVQTVVVPTFITPLLIGAVIWYISSIAVDEGKKTYDVAVYDQANTELTIKLQESDRLNIVLMDSIDQVIDDVTNDSSEIGISFGSNFTSQLENNLSGEITIYSKNLDNFSQAQGIVNDVIDDYDDQIRNERLNNLNVDENFINPITVLDEDLTTNEEFAGSIIGGILAFLFIVYIMSGSMYPAIDLGAGEKERGTMETLISTNISSVDIIIGKMFSVTSSAVLTAIFSLLGFAVPLIVIFLFYGDSIPENAFEIISAIVNPVAIIAMFGLLIPLSIFMGAFMLAVSIYSKNPKEASLLLGNAVIIFFIPAYVPLINPGIELDLVGSLIPCYSFALHTNALIAGNTDWFLYGATLISNIIYCSIAIYVTYIMFDDEKIIFRS
jgi:sodium transport system permease protein|tara:strand:- start:373 stop:1581 length:1209 start_codon:yes stop_codon:yes gene_type:complete